MLPHPSGSSSEKHTYVSLDTQHESLTEESLVIYSYGGQAMVIEIQADNRGRNQDGQRSEKIV